MSIHFVGKKKKKRNPYPRSRYLTGVISILHEQFRVLAADQIGQHQEALFQVKPSCSSLLPWIHFILTS